MIQFSNYRSEPSLIHNGHFTEGLSGWFGCYLKHRSGAIIFNNEPQELRPEYGVEIPGARFSDYLPGTPPGLNQFLDLPEMYTFPSVRFAEKLLLRYATEDQIQLSIQSNTTLNGAYLAPGDPNAAGQDKYFQHPFLFVDDNGDTPITIGTNITVSSPGATDVDGVYKAGPVNKITTGSSADIREHTLSVASSHPVTPVIDSKLHFPEVVISAGGATGAGVNVLRFLGPGFDQILTFPRPDGPPGLRVNDTLVMGNIAVRIETVLTVINNDPNQGGPSYNTITQNIPGFDGLSDAASFEDWKIIPVVTVDAQYEMPLHRYEYTLAYSFATPLLPEASYINFRLLDEDTINGIGDAGETIRSNTATAVTVTGETTETYRRRFEHLIRESAEVIEGRPLLTIPPVVTGDPLQQRITSAKVLNNGSRVHLRFPVEALPGARITLATYSDNSRICALKLEDEYPFGELDSTLAFTGIPPDSAPVWFQQIVQKNKVFNIAFQNPVDGFIYIDIPVGDIVATVFPNATGLENTIIRVSNASTPTPRYTPLVTPIQFSGEVSPPVDFLDEILGNTYVFSGWQVEDADMTANFATAYIRDFLTAGPQDGIYDMGESTFIVSREDLDDVVTAIIGDIGLWRGFLFNRLNATDDPDVSNPSLTGAVTIDNFKGLVDPVANCIPRGTTVLYAGGGLCPNGFKAVRSKANDPSGTFGIGTIREIPWPDSGGYDFERDVTRLVFTDQSFPQLDPEGNPIYIPGSSAFITTSTGQLVERKRARQLIEPGMILRVPDVAYEVGDSSLVDDQSMRSTRYLAPVDTEDRGFLITNVRSRLDGAPAVFPSAPPHSYLGVTAFSRFGGGRGEISYPASDSGEFSQTNVYPVLPPAGPPRGGQTERFNYAATRVAFLVIRGIFNSSLGPRTGLRLEGMLTPFDEAPGYYVDGHEVRIGNDFFTQSIGDATNHFRSGDVYFAEMHAYAGNTPSQFGSIQQNSTPLSFHSSFLVYVQYSGQGRKWNAFRYDRRPIKLLDVGSSEYPRDTVDGNSSHITRAFLVLRPAKLYGSPFTPQVLKDVSDGGSQTPQGAGEDFVQSSISGTSGPTWLAQFVGASLEIEVTGRLARPNDLVTSLIVEPSGYLRYDLGSTGIDYGNSAHTHSVESNNELVNTRGIPRLHPEQYNEPRYNVERLPSEHGHGSVGDVTYSLPPALLLTLCIKI